MREKWFCLIDVKFFEEDTYVPRHNKMILRVETFEEAFQFVNDYFGADQISSINMKWAGKDDSECKQELVFTESEFDYFENVKYIIEHDRSYEDYCIAEKEYKEKRGESNA